jgi:hypothetical protein
MPAWGQTGDVLLRTGAEPDAFCTTTGATVSVEIQVANLSDAINGVQVLLQYDDSLLTLDPDSTTEAPSWTRVALTDTAGDVDYAIVKNGGSIGPGPGPFTVATLVFDADVEGSSNIVFRPDNPPFHTKLIIAADESTIFPGTTDSGEISVDDTTATANSNSPVCKGSTIELYGGLLGSGAVGPYTYDWAGPDGFTSDQQNPTIPSATPAMAGTYTFTLINSNGCATTDQTDVVVIGPDCIISSVDSACAGTNGLIASVPDAGVGATYLWGITGGTITAGQGTNEITYSAGGAGTLTLTIDVTDADACSCSDSLDVTIFPNPDCTITTVVDACADEPGYVASVPDAGGGATYTWGITGGTITAGQGTGEITYAAGPAGTLSLTVDIINTNGCECFDTVDVTINPLPTPTITATPDTVECEGTTITLDAGAGYAAYLWSPGGETTQSIDVTTSGTYSVTVTDANGCEGSDSYELTMLPLPACDITADAAVCASSTGNVASAPAGLTSYNWVIADGTITSGQGTDTITYSVGMTSTVALEVTVEDATGCVNTCVAVIPIESCITVNITVEALAGAGGDFPYGTTTAHPTGDAVDREVEFVVTSCGSTSDIRTEMVTFNSNGTTGVGSYLLTNVDPTSTYIAVREGHTLRTLSGVDLSLTGSATVAVSLKAGDFHTATVAQDNLVDIVDFSILASRWDTIIAADESIGGDATGDGVQGVADFTAIQVNFFEVGDDEDQCAALAGPPEVPRRGLHRIGVEQIEPDVPWAHPADLTGDGVIDADDIRAFARKHELELLPSFEAKLDRWQPDLSRGLGAQRRPPPLRPDRSRVR